MDLKLPRRLKYLYLKFITLRDDPRELALGMAVGIFTGMLPIIPFQTALALAIAVFFRTSKITAVLGTWISNPLNWYILYYLSYKLGAFVLMLPEKNASFRAIMNAVQSGSDVWLIVENLLSSGGLIVSAFLIGGLIMGTVASIPSYFIFLRFFRYLRVWRKARKEKRKWKNRVNTG